MEFVDQRGDDDRMLHGTPEAVCHGGQGCVKLDLGGGGQGSDDDNNNEEGQGPKQAKFICGQRLE